jgi:hypothetical protein
MGRLLALLSALLVFAGPLPALAQPGMFIPVYSGVAPPTCGPASTTVAEGSSSNPLTLSLGGGAPTSVHVISGPSNGSTSITGTTIFYTPTGGYAGSDSLTYTAQNSAGTCTAATASITVTFTPVVHAYTSGSGTETVPTGASTLVDTCWGGGGAGEAKNVSVGSGGGGAAQFIKTLGVTGGNTLSYAIGVGGTALFSGFGAGTNGTDSTVSGTVSGGSISADAGGGVAGSVSAGGAGGTATGGDTNTSGATGGGIGVGTGGTAGGTGGGTANNPPGGGGSGGMGSGSGFSGGNGECEFSYTWLILQAPVWAANDNETHRAAA